MKNNEKKVVNQSATTLDNINDIETLNGVIERYNNDIVDNVTPVFTFTDIETALARVNDTAKKLHAVKFIESLKKDRKMAFESLLKDPCYTKYIISLNNVKRIESKAITVINDITFIESVFQYGESVEKDKNGKALKNKGVTIFGALRFYGLLESFTRNLLINQIESGNDYKTDLTRVIIDNEKIFSESDGKAFLSNSITALDKQLRVLTKFFGELDIKTKKKDLPLLRSQSLKLKFDAKAKTLDFSESKIESILKILYKYFVSVYNGHETTLKDISGKTINLTESKKADK